VEQLDSRQLARDMAEKHLTERSQGESSEERSQQVNLPEPQMPRGENRIQIKENTSNYYMDTQHNKMAGNLQQHKLNKLK